MKPEVDKSLKRLGYGWHKQKPEEIGEIVSDFLKKANAESYLMDVYSNGGSVYRNIHIEWEEHFFVRIVDIRFNKIEHGRAVNLEITEKMEAIG